jgi:hypothetical protein
LEIHAKAQTDDGVLEEFLGHIFIESRVGLSAKQGINQSYEKHYRRSDPCRKEMECRDIIAKQTQRDNG